MAWENGWFSHSRTIWRPAKVVNYRFSNILPTTCWLTGQQGILPPAEHLLAYSWDESYASVKLFFVQVFEKSWWIHKLSRKQHLTPKLSFESSTQMTESRLVARLHSWAERTQVLQVSTSHVDIRQSTTWCFTPVLLEGRFQLGYRFKSWRFYSSMFHADNEGFWGVKEG